MSVQNGDGMMVEVQTAAGPPAVYALVQDVNAYDSDTGSDVTEVPVFQRSTPHAFDGPASNTITVAGLFNDDDAGQQALRAAQGARTTVVLRITFDGTNGYTREFRISRRTHGARPREGQSFSMELTAVADAVVEGTGPIP
jgi:hypothetical protein